MRIPSALPVLFLLIAVGCGDGRRPIHGSINYEGNPVEQGQIVFEPTESGQRMAIGQIANGSYKIEGMNGPTPGSYKVRIDGIKMVPSPNLKLPDYLNEGKEGEPVMVPENYIPAEYNKDSTLTVEVVEDKDEYSFDLKKP